ncbi:hypothetical protein D8T49_22525 [Vibrio vulnificus]|uniref:hypothetical protein n=1 Tax=Vibrio vulnificus TaxID=672 RepID=UPI0010238E11|nr:hypothetical protein [Vibrio vulnificus]MCU8190229.1 hypothetical protein [Vibrio vulnificus]MCU8199024.1 hypothetical protein [Vibrio vulnificus]MCU8313215.1 hypothetical protein [Vibrio vulnificus]RZP96468.1 hypothetical protein D8T37_22600 [Vibrio vulnificus]RZQ43550.1 hypothetical protein D8T49_22525 [Vibrio vulnificus]
MAVYKGFKEDIEDGWIDNIYWDQPRSPTHMGKVVHEVADSFFEERFGVKARTSTVICSTCKDQAYSYTDSGSGSLVEITELSEGSTIIFSEQVDDLIAIRASSNLGESTCPVEIRCWLEKKEYTEVDCISKLPADFKGEVMIACKTLKVMNVQL